MRQVPLDLAVDLRSPDRRASRRGPRHGRESPRHSIGGLSASALRRRRRARTPRRARSAVVAVERRCALREERLRSTMRATRASLRESGRARARAAAATRETGCRSTSASARRLSLPCATKSFEARPSSRGVGARARHRRSRRRVRRQHRPRRADRRGREQRSDARPCRGVSALGHAGACPQLRQSAPRATCA